MLADTTRILYSENTCPIALSNPGLSIALTKRLVESSDNVLSNLMIGEKSKWVSRLGALNFTMSGV